MALSAKTIRSQLNILKKMLSVLSLPTLRRGQNKIGEMMEAKFREQVIRKDHAFDRFDAAWCIPRDERRQGVILYLHGGGYTCGGLEYALGFGSMLAVRSAAKVFCGGYRLAPEHPFPAAVEDALICYRYLLDKGYSPAHITLCGESAGGGLCYSLCMELKRLGLPMPAGIIAISPWADLTQSGGTMESNRENDPSMSKETLDFFAKNYTDTPEAPLASPLFGDLTGMPPSLIFAGGDEILLSDAQRLHEKLLSAGCRSRLWVKEERWHAYLLYGLREDEKDLDAINAFLSAVMAKENKLRWMPLDNAAKIYPAARRQNWSNVYRLSMTLTEDVDEDVLRSALDVTVRRFPSIAARLRKGIFWYYLEQLSAAPELTKESSYPLVRMTRKEMGKCAFRVIVYKKRIAVEFFHSLTDGTGGLIFLKSLVAEYLQQKYGIHIPARHGVLGRLEEPSSEELEDSFQKYAGPIQASRRETDAWNPRAEIDLTGFKHLTCFTLPVEAVRQKAKEYGVTVTAFLSAVMMDALQDMQADWIRNIRRRKAIKVLIPVNLRNLFPSRSLRNFALYSIPEISPRLGHYSFSEICQVVRHRMGLDVTAKHMSAMIATNVSSERIPIVKVMPLFIKNIVMKAVFDAVGERKSCLCLSNLGQVKLPDEMAPYIDRVDFVLGVQASSPYNCGVASWGDKLYVNFIRNVKHSELEAHFYAVLRRLGIPAAVESNQQEV